MSNTQDDVAGDLLTMLVDSGVIKKDERPSAKPEIDLLMQKLCSYIVRHDHKVWNHAYQLGKSKAKSS